ncbi:hypothetical protein [Streptomyces lunaelactis]|nr:hypothetical protein [Streptomyces lunaelactis]
MPNGSTSGSNQYGVLQPLVPDQVDRSVAAATTPAARLILARLLLD